jgi:hypothetical protein
MQNISEILLLPINAPKPFHIFCANILFANNIDLLIEGQKQKEGTQYG